MSTESIVQLLEDRDVSSGFVRWARDEADDLMQLWHACYRADWLVELLVGSKVPGDVIRDAMRALDAKIAELAPSVEAGCERAFEAAHARGDARGALPQIAVFLGDAAEQDPTYRENPPPKVRPTTEAPEPRNLSTLAKDLFNSKSRHALKLEAHARQALYYEQAQLQYADAVRSAVPWESVRVALGDTGAVPYR